MRGADLAALNAARAVRKAMLVVTPLDGSPGRLVAADAIAADPLADALAERLAAGTSARVGEVFVRVHRPEPRLVLIGAVHVSQALAPMAVATGFDLTIVDPREAFATPERFGAYRLLAEWPEPGLLALDAETAVATLTHDPKIDDIALKAALDADCFYIGALGSRKTHGKRVERLTAAGYDAAQIGRIHAPIGLAIGAGSPAEIAVSILAEIVATLRAKRTVRRHEPA